MARVFEGAERRATALYRKTLRATPQPEGKIMPGKILLVLCFSMLSSCSRDSEVISLSQKFFDAYDQKDFKLAYTMLSPVDKRYMSADSFYVMSCKMEDQIARLDSSSAVSMFIERTAGDTSWVRQVWRVPDYSLINESKPHDVKLSEFFAKIDSAKAVPIRLDSSRAVRVVGEQGGLYVYLGLDRFKKFTDSYRAIMGSYSFMVIVVPESIKVYRAGHGNYAAEASVRITNYSPFLVTGFFCSISIDKNLYDSDCDAFAEATVESGQSVVGTVKLSRVPVLLSKRLPNGSSSGRIKGDRIAITPTTVYFGKKECAFMRDFAMRQSGFTGFTFLAPGYDKLLLDF